LAVLGLTLTAFRLPINESLQLLWDGAFGDQYAMARTLVKMSPLLLCTLGMVVAWRAGMYNIGGEGQYIFGALCAASLFKAVPNLPGGVGTVGLAAACALGGAGYAWLAAWLYVKRGVNVVISTILLNFIALQLLSWAVSGPLQRAKGDVPQSEALPDALMFFRFDPRMDLHAGVFTGLVAAAGLFFWLFWTPAGFRLRLTGENPFAARAARIEGGNVQIKAMALSGSLCGLAAASEYLGVTGSLDAGFAQQWGFLAIPVALLGNLHPLGAIASGLFFASLFSGSENLARFTTSGTTLIYVMQAVAVLGFAGLRTWNARRQLAGSAEA
jgi:ABC-type uncharacterized transport system permease subunit